jgi:propionaldehyde dehydrogenase
MFDTMKQAITVSQTAQKRFEALSLQKRREIIEAMRRAARKDAEKLAKEARKETGMGRWKDKLKKNLLVADKTPGLEDLQPEVFTGDHSVSLTERIPFGVVGAVTPCTNPTSTIINNSISIVAGANSVIFAPHPAAKRCSQQTISILQQAVENAGGPAALISSVNEPSLDAAKQLFYDERVEILIVTGGPGVVKAAMKSGKKVIAAGPGNPPVLIDETAFFPKCAQDIISGSSFDNGIICASEKEVIVVEKIKDRFLQSMRDDVRACELTSYQMDELARICINGSRKDSGDPNREGELNRNYVGKNASVIAKAVGLNLPDHIRLLWGVVNNDHPLVWNEQLMPVLPVMFVKTVEKAINFAVKVEKGNNHTFIMHSSNTENLTKMASAAPSAIFVKNGPSYMAIGMGEGYAALSIATATGDGLVRARTFTRPMVSIDYFKAA